MSDLLNPDKEFYPDDDLNHENTVRPQSFDDFAGQAHILENLEVFVKAWRSIRSRFVARTSRFGKNDIGKYYCE